MTTNDLEQLAKECGEDVVRYICSAVKCDDDAVTMRGRVEAIILAALTRVRADLAKWDAA